MTNEYRIPGTLITINQPTTADDLREIVEIQARQLREYEYALRRANELQAGAELQTAHAISRMARMDSVYAQKIDSLHAQYAQACAEKHLAPCGGTRCWRDGDGHWVHSSKSYESCTARRGDE